MELKSKLRIPIQQLALALKALVFAGFLGIAAIGNFHIIPVLFFIITTVILYATPIFNTVAYLFSFLALLIFSLAIHVHFSGDSTIFLISVSALLLYFVMRERWHYVYLLGIFILFFLIFFAADKSQFLFLKLSGVFAAQFFLWREFFKLNTNDMRFVSRHAVTITSAVIAFITAQLTWVAIVLPLELLHAVNLSLLVVFVVTDVIIKYFRNSLSRNAALVNVTIFIIFSILIFATS
jgi:hypothetical protein